MFKSHLNELDYGMPMHFMQQKRASRHSGRSFARGATCAIQFHRSALVVILGQLRWPIYILWKYNPTISCTTSYSTVSNLYIKIGRFVHLIGSVSECRNPGMPIMSQCQPYATMQHCGHAAVFGRRHLARSALRPCPTACMRECLHRCVRWEDEEVAGWLQRAAISYLR